MAMTITVLAYFVDMLPHVVGDNVVLLASNDNSISGGEEAQDN